MGPLVGLVFRGKGKFSFLDSPSDYVSEDFSAYSVVIVHKFCTKTGPWSVDP